MDVDRAMGTEVAGYAIESVLGRGAMGVVYVARQASPERRVALKLITPAMADDRSFRDRFLREARAAAAIDHPHILPVYAAGETDGVLFIAMRLVEGEDLRTILHAGGPLEPERALSIVWQIGSALDAAHARGLIHRDVKPGNILVAPRSEDDDEDFCYLADFGVSTWATSSAGTLTSTGHMVGSLHYAAPEQIEGRRAGPAADVYSLGCVLFECLTGHPPFAGRTAPGILYAHLHEDPPAASPLRPELPSGVDPVLARALAKDPEERYGSCRGLGRDLHVTLAGEDVERPASGPVRAPRPVPRRRDRWLGGAALVATVLVAAVLVALFVRGDAGPRGGGSPKGSPPPTGAVERIRRGVQVTASLTAPASTDAAGHPVTFLPKNVIDGNVETAWRAPGDGHGVTLTLLFDNPVDVVRIGLIPGYAKTDPETGVNRFQQNRIIRRVRYVIPGLPPIEQTFRPQPVPQFVRVDATTGRITVEILDTGPAHGADDTAISEIYVYGSPQ